jgi:orotate phosphoribosyltransferase
MPTEAFMKVDPRTFENIYIDAMTVRKWFTLCGAAWMHDGNPENPHAELTSGMCSNGFFDCLRVLKHVNFSEILANQLAKRIRLLIGDVQVDWVIGSPMAGITFAHDVARKIGAHFSAFVEKDPENSGRMLWKRMEIPAGAKVLQIEELITTAKTLNAVQRAVNDGNKELVKWIPVIGALVHRPPKLPVNFYGERRVVPLLEEEVWAVPPEECPLCKAGSARYRPKTHWTELTGKAKKFL